MHSPRPPGMESLESLPVDESLPPTVREQQIINEYFEALPETRSMGWSTMIKLLLGVAFIGFIVLHPMTRQFVRRSLGKDPSSQQVFYVQWGFLVAGWMVVLYMLSKNNML